MPGGVVQHNFVLVLLLDIFNSGAQPLAAALREHFPPLGIFDVLLSSGATVLQNHHGSFFRNRVRRKETGKVLHSPDASKRSDEASPKVKARNENRNHRAMAWAITLHPT